MLMDSGLYLINLQLIAIINHVIASGCICGA